MRILSDTEIYRTRSIVVAKLRRETLSKSGLFLNRRDYESWLTSATHEGIALALRSEDKFDKTRGNFAQWVYLKARKAAWRDLERERKYDDLCALLKAEPVIEVTDPFAQNLLVGQTLDGLAKELTPDQAQVIAFVFLLGYSHAETAVILRRERNAVDALVHRAKAKAREVYQRNLKGNQSRTLVKPEFEKAIPKPRVKPRPRNALDDEQG